MTLVVGEKKMSEELQDFEKNSDPCSGRKKMPEELQDFEKKVTLVIRGMSL